MEFLSKKQERTILCGICGEKHIPQDCDMVPVKCLIPDKVYPSRAKMSLPDDLLLTPLADATYRVTTSVYLEKGTVFGPMQAKKMCSLMPSIDFPLKVFVNDEEDFLEYYLDTSDEYECNWMIFIKAASNFEEQNMIIYQEDDDLFYVTSRDVYEGEELRVWYSPYYAVRMKIDMLEKTVDKTEVKQKPDDLLVMKHSDVAPREIWNCKFCGKIESKITEFTKHLLVHYRAVSRYTCEICAVSFGTKKIYRKHMRIVHNSKLPLETKLEIDATAVQKTSPTENSKETPFGGPLLMNDITCDSLDNTTLNLILPQSFELNQDTLLEQNLNVDSILNENVKDLDHFNFELNEQEAEQLICDVCLKKFTKLSNLITHLQQHTGKFTCFDCKKVFTRRENFKFHACKAEYLFKCPVCDKLFYQKKFLNRHIKVYHVIFCANCNKIFKDQGELEQHQPCKNKRLPMQKTLQCKECTKKFTWKKNLTVHIKKHHHVESFTCPDCGQVLTNRRTYENHLKIHSNQNFPCDVCSKVFTRKDSLISHKKIIHEGGVVTCEICDQELKSVKLLKEHQKTHAQDGKIQCLHCNSEYKSKRTLQKHVARAHTDRRVDSKTAMYDYSCPKCKKKMKFKSSLIRHMRICHPDYVYDMKNTSGKGLNDDDILDLKQTIENMDFNTDEVNNCSENNEINMEIDKLFNNDTIFLNDSNERLVDTLIECVVNETNRSHYENKGVCLSMPDLSETSEIKLSDSVYGMEGNAKKDDSNIVLYLPDNDKDD